jgi:hypothetical protein
MYMSIPVATPRFNEMTPELEVLGRHEGRQVLFAKLANEFLEHRADASSKSPTIG